ncbi:MAG: hypothetical protein MK096_03310 [Oleiphilaceae bacterium]|nr:hypothetical protein [Oleiphilaceae bacterium]
MTQKAKANFERAQTTYLRFKTGHESAGSASPFSQQVDNRKKLFEEAKAAYHPAQADEKRQELIAESIIAGENTIVAQLIEARNRAQLDLDRTIIRAPSDGTPVQVGIRRGTFAAALPLRPAMSFIPTEKIRIAARFWQNSLLRMKVGLEAEVILDAVSGHVFEGKLVDLQPAMAEGEIQAADALIATNRIAQHGFAIGIIEFEEDLNDYNLPLGIQGQAVALNYEDD